MPSEVRFAVVKKMLVDAGWTLARVSGSHHVFTKPGQVHFSIPVHHGKVKPYYVEEAKKRAQPDPPEEAG